MAVAQATLLRQPMRRKSKLGKLVRFAELATTPLLPADYLDLFAPLRAGAELRGRVVSTHPETADAATILIEPGADWRGHTPGQYVRIGVDVDGVRHWRAYSLTHGPRTDGLISITVKAVPDGRVSTHLVRNSPVGTLLQLEQAAGDFILPATGGRFLFVTAGSGITPIIGMLRNLFPVTDSGVLRLGRAKSYDIAVVHIAPREPDSIFAAQLRELGAAGAIRLVTHYTDEVGGFSVDPLGQLVPDLSERRTYACGPSGLLDALREHHEARDLALQVEQFRAPMVAVGEGGTVTFTNAGVAVAAAGGTPILDAAESAGVLMPSGCRMGICYGCVLPMRSGSVRDLRTGEVTTTTPAETGTAGLPIQTCISAAAGSCELIH